MTQPLISVVMAAYNGEKYLRAQIQSILPQLGPDDELIVSLDPSSDQSTSILSDFSKGDARVRLVEGPRQGLIANFENALRFVRGDYIFLSDQDDVWVKDKIAQCMPVLTGDCVTAVVHDAFVTDEALNVVRPSFFEGSFYSGRVKTIIKNRYIGCCMAFKRPLLKTALPFPKNLPMHDQWLGLLAKSQGDVIFINKPLLYYRRHEGTATGQSRAGLLQKLRWRMNIALAYMKRSVVHGKH